MRHCNKCNTDKEDIEFKLNRFPHCKDCERKRDRLRKADRKKESKEYYLNNREAIRLKQQEYWTINNDRLKEQTLANYHKNSDIINSKKRQNHSSNKSKYHATRLAYMRSDQGKAVRHSNERKRRALKLLRTHPDHDTSFERTLEFQRQRLQKCLGVKFHIDHIIPLTKGGLHYHLNLQVIPATMNLRKGNKLKSE